MITKQRRDKLSKTHLGRLNPQYKVGLEKFRSYEWLYQRYWEDELSLTKIAKIIGISIRCLAKWMDKVNIKRRKSGTRFGHCPNFKGWHINTQRYKLLFIPEHPFCNKQGYIREHRFIAEKCLGRYLKSTERIHHIHDDKLDNRPENLYLFLSASLHDKYHQMKRMKSKGFILITKSNL